MIYCSVKYCSNSSIPGVILHSIMKSIYKTPNHPAYHWSTLWLLEVCGLYNSWWFCVQKLSMFIYLSMAITFSIKRKFLFRNFITLRTEITVLYTVIKNVVFNFLSILFLSIYFLVTNEFEINRIKVNCWIKFFYFPFQIFFNVNIEILTMAENLWKKSKSLKFFFWRISPWFDFLLFMKRWKKCITFWYLVKVRLSPS